MRAKIILAIILLSNMASGTVSAFPVNLVADSNRQSVHDNSDRERYFFEIGMRLGEAIARDYSIFIGIVSSVSSSLTKDETTGEKKSISHNPEVHVAVNEWLWNKSGDNVSELTLKNFPASRPKPFEASASPDGKDISPHVGDQMLIASYIEKDTPSGKVEISKYAMILTDASLFQQVRDTVNRHALYTKEPSSIINELQGLGSTDDLIFCGYLVRYLWRAARPNSFGYEAVVLSKLLTNRHLPSSGWPMIRITLSRQLLNTNFPLSEVSRNIVIDNLVEASSRSANVQLAKQTIPILLSLSESKQLDMKPFLDPSRLRNLNANYRSLRATGYIQGRHTDFESQLGW